MMIVASFLVFMLVHQRAVCNELYPISVINYIEHDQYIVDDQPVWSPVNYTEQGQIYDKTFPALNSPLGDVTDQKDLDWIKEYIVRRYNFVKHDKRDEWKKQPDFKADLGKREFAVAADQVKKFFDRNNNWEETKTKFRTEDSCINLLYITAARYLLVTHILHVESGKKLIPCARSGNKIVIPDSGVCFPAPYGSATCTSDYDVGLIGKNAGNLTERFNNYFQGANGFGKPSELVFDTNVYAFTLEFAMPFYFDKLPAGFAAEVATKEKTINYKMQELASAYFKVYKYNKDFFEKLKLGAEEGMNKTKTAPDSKKKLNEWMDKLTEWNETVGMRNEDFQSAETLRLSHNNVYQKLVKEMSRKGGYKSNLLDTLAKALIYAAEAYHTRGAIRHIVGGTQMKVIDVSPRTPLSVNDLWVSMIENWGESNKEYNHCKEKPLVECFLKMSKYMWRVFNAMRMVRPRLPTRARQGLVRFGQELGDPEHASAMWRLYKKKGATKIPSTKAVKLVKSFLKQFDCDLNINIKTDRIPPNCLDKMNEKINDYNIVLASLVKDVTLPSWHHR